MTIGTTMDGVMSNVYANEKKCSPEGTAHHRRKFFMFKDGFNRRWKECVMFGRWLTFDTSRVAGWYHSPITQGPDPKPIRTGTIIHSQSITHGDLASYKVHVRVFGRATDDGRGFGQNEQQHRHHPKVGEPAVVDA